MSLRIGRVQCHGLLEVRHGVGEAVGRPRTLRGDSEQVVVVGIETRRWRVRGDDGVPAGGRHDGIDDGGRKFGLHREDVVDLAVEAAGPELEARTTVDELGIDLQLAAVASHAALQHGSHAELAGNGLHVLCACL